MKIITAKKLKRYINEYAVSKGKKSECVHIWFRVIYERRVFGLCFIRNGKIFDKLKK